MTPDVAETDRTVPGPAEPADLCDPESGLVLVADRMLAVASADSAAAALVVDRLARYVDSAVTWGSIPLSDLALTEVRRRILMVDNDACLFSGTLRETLATRADHSDAEVRAALWTAGADDIVALLPDGLDSRIEPRARNLSGGQQQRLRLARALLADPEVLLLVDPTSAVDAHTEATIAARVHAARRGRATVVVGTSPLLLDRADEVAYLVAGRVVAVGTHGALLESQPGYRELVFRGADDDEPLRSVAGSEEVAR